jgi:thiol-disulfide isomerase/thioredoxin
MAVTNSRIRRAVLATAAATALVVAGLLAYRAYEAGRRASSPDSAADRTAPSASAGTAVSLNPLELSVFDQPRPMPEIRFADEHGRDLTLADFHGKIVLLNIWATWCIPCRKEMPTLDRLQGRLGSEDFQVIALSIDRGGITPVKAFYQQLRLEKLGIYVDPSGTGSRALAVPGVPATLLIDRDGREIARKMGEAAWDDPEIVSLIERAIQGRSASGRGESR